MAENRGRTSKAWIVAVATVAALVLVLVTALLYYPALRADDRHAASEAFLLYTNDAAHEGRLNLNSCNKEELCTLPGIGEKRAEAILEYRDAMGGFSAVEELMLVDGIGEKIFEGIRELVYV